MKKKGTEGGGNPTSWGLQFALGTSQGGGDSVRVLVKIEEDEDRCMQGEA
jgi:hypothetical protein